MNGDGILLDMHTHLMPPAGLTRFAGVAWSPTDEELAVDGGVVEAKELFHPAKLIAWMDQNSVQKAWISPPPPAFRPNLDAETAFAWAKALDAGLEEIATDHPRRLTPLAFIPVEHPDVAATLVRESAGQRRFAMSTGSRGVVLSDPAYDPLWAALDSMRALLFLHPGRGADARLAKFYLRNLLGNPHETAIAAAHLVLGGVADRFPGINFIFAHGGGTTPILAGRWQHGYDARSSGVDCTIAPPAMTLRRMRADSVTHGLAGLRAAEAVFGPDNIVFGSDWPFPMGTLKPMLKFADLDRESSERIFRINPRRLLQI